MSSTQTLILGLERNRFFKDADGALATVLDEDEIIGITLDWSDKLADGETISTSVWTQNGITTSAESNTTTTTSADITGTGDVTNQVTLNTARVLKMRLRAYRPEDAPYRRDYC